MGHMSLLLVSLAAVVAVAAAMRSTWSPCGLSMLSTITPIGERGRNHRYGVTAAWFVAGAVLGGLTLGAATVPLTVVVASLDLGGESRLVIVALLAVVSIASDLQIGGFRLPSHIRQVNETWLDQYRAWVYGGGFGWQIGVGVATYITTAAVYLLIALMALTASPVAALSLGAAFGLVRGLAVLLGRGLTTPHRMMALHRRLDELLPAAQRAVVAVEVGVLAVAVGVSVGAIPALALALLGFGGALARRPHPVSRLPEPV